MGKSLISKLGQLMIGIWIGMQAVKGDVQGARKIREGRKGKGFGSAWDKRGIKDRSDTDLPNEYTAEGEIKILQENVPGYVVSSDVVALRDIQEMSLAVRGGSDTIKPSFNPLFKEFPQATYKKNEFTDSFGFRLGNSITQSYQIIILQRSFTLFQFDSQSRAPDNKWLRYIAQWNLDDLLPENKGYVATSSTGPMQDTTLPLESVRFILLLKNSQNTNQQMLVNILVEGKYNSGKIIWGIRVESFKEASPMLFTTTPPSRVNKRQKDNNKDAQETIPCKASMKYLPNLFDESQNKTKAFYFARYCKLSQVAFVDQSKYFNTIEVYKMEMTSRGTTISMVQTLDKIRFNNNEYNLQLIMLKQFNNQLIIFVLDATFVVTGNSKTGLLNDASLKFLEEKGLLGLAKCRQNDYDVLTCSQKNYKKICPSGSNENCTVSDLVEYFVEFTKTSQSLTRIPPISVMVLNGSDKIVSINSNFLVYKRPLQEGEKAQTLFSFVQRGSTKNLMQQTVDGTVLFTKRIGPPFIMFKTFDMGLMVKKVQESSDGQNPAEQIVVSLYTLQLPYFNISVGENPPQSTCFMYTSNCHFTQLEFNYTDTENRTFTKYLNYFHIAGQFNSLLPKILSRSYEQKIVRDKFEVNITEIVHGLMLDYKVASESFVPGEEKMATNVSLMSPAQGYTNLVVNITDVRDSSFDISFGEHIKRIKIHFTQYADGSFYAALILVLDSPSIYGGGIILEIPDTIDTNFDTDFSMSVKIMNQFKISMFSTLLGLWVIENELHPGKYVYIQHVLGKHPTKEVSPSTYDFCFTRTTFNIYCQEFIPEEQLTPLNPTVKILRSRDSQADNIFILFNQTMVLIYEIVADDFPMLQVPLKLLDFTNKDIIDMLKLSQNIEQLFTNYMEFMLLDVLMVNFDLLLLQVRGINQKDKSDVVEAIFIYQCNVKTSPGSCFFYSFITLDRLATTTVFVDYSSYNLVTVSSVSSFSSSEVVLSYYRLDLYGFDLLNSLQMELLPSKQINLSDTVEDNLLLSTNMKPSMYAVKSVFSFPVNKMEVVKNEVTVKPSRVLVFDFSLQLQGVKSESLGPDFTSFKISKSQPPNNFPIIISKGTDNTVTIQCLNPSNGFEITTGTTNGLKSSLDSTKNYTLTTMNRGYLELVQIFQGVSYYDFDILPLNLPSKEETKYYKSISMANGFVENINVVCPTDGDNSQEITRNQTISLICANDEKSSKNKTSRVIFNSFMTKDFDFVPNNYIGNSPSNSTFSDKLGSLYPGNVTDFFVIDGYEDFILVLHSEVSLVRVGDFSKVVAFLNLTEPGKKLINYSFCSGIKQGAAPEGFFRVELECGTSEHIRNAQIYAFEVNIATLKRAIIEAESIRQLPIVLSKQATKFLISRNEWYLSNIKKPLEVQYREGFFFVLSSIVLENYNNKTYLNIFMVKEVPPINNDSLPIMKTELVWSSLSLDDFSNYTIRKFQINKVKTVSSVAKQQYSVGIVSDQENKGTFLTFLTVIKISGQKAPLIVSKEPLLLGPNLIFDHIMLFSMRSKLHVFGFTNEEITEWTSDDLEEAKFVSKYSFFQICSLDAAMQVHKLDSMFLLYCYNSTLDAGSGDILMLYDTHYNKKGTLNRVDPLFQLTLPDVDPSRNSILSVYSSKDSDCDAKMLLSSARNFLSQYSLRTSKSGLAFEEPSEIMGPMEISASLVFSNALQSLSVTVKFQINYWDIVEDFLMTISSEIVLLFLIVLYGLIILGVKKWIKEKTNSSKDSKKGPKQRTWRQADWLAEKFISRYEKLNSKR